MELFPPKILAAFEFAAYAHKDQLRKNPPDMPYFSHPAAVALILSRAGFSDDVVIAGVLHDVVEDTSFSLEDIEKKFGPVVSKLVQGVTENTELPWKERKVAYMEHLQTASKEEVAISAADFLANEQSMLLLLTADQNPWPNFANPKKHARPLEEYVELTIQFQLQRLGIIKKIFPELAFLKELETAAAKVRKLSKLYYPNIHG